MTNSLQRHFQEFAQYNRWATRRIMASAQAIPDGERKRDRGAFFKSLHGVLNHLLVAERIWLGRLQGASPSDYKLDQILFDHFNELAAGLDDADGTIIEHVEALTPERFDETLAYTTLGGDPQCQKRREILAHVFNHQTHHRGQATDLIQLINGAPPVLDLLYFQRSRQEPGAA